MFNLNKVGWIIFAIFIILLLLCGIVEIFSIPFSNSLISLLIEFPLLLLMFVFGIFCSIGANFGNFGSWLPYPILSLVGWSISVFVYVFISLLIANIFGRKNKL